MTAPSPRTRLGALPPEALFVVSAVSQYVGASIAVDLFDDAEPHTVAWFRVLGATLALLAVSPGFHRGWTRRTLAGAAVFGIVTALMNMLFYMAIDRLDLGSSVAIEFVGPIAVAAATTRTRRNAVALAVAGAGVLTLGGLELGDNGIGLLFVLAASAMWASYIVIGARIANVRSGVAGLGVGLAIGTVVLAPVGLPGSGPVWASASLLVLCLATGVFSNAIGYGIDQHVLRRVPVRRFSLLLATLPVTAVVVGWIALGQRPGLLQLLGVALVLAGVAVQERESVASELAAPEPS